MTNKMHILIYGINYAPELTGIGKYSTEMCEYMSRKGHRIYMLGAYPYYPFGMDFSSWYKEKKPGRFFFDEEINGVTVMRVNLFKPKKPGILRRIIHELSFLLMSFLRLFFFSKRYDIIICISPPLLLGLVAYIMSRLKKVPFIFHIKDLQPDAAVELGMLKEGAFTALLYAIERFIYKKSRYVFTISEGMRNKIIEKGIARDKVKIFFDWSDVGTLRPMAKENDFAREHGLIDKFVVLHAGNMGEKQDMYTIVEAALKMKGCDSICFLIVGRGVKRDFVERYVEEHDLSNVLLLDVQPRSRLNEMYASADVSLVMQGKNVKDIVMPSKVFGPASVERPLIVGGVDDCEVSKIVKKYNFGLIIPPEDSEALVKAIDRLRNDSKMGSLMGENGRNFMAKERGLEMVIDRFEEDIQHICR